RRSCSATAGPTWRPCSRSLRRLPPGFRRRRSSRGCRRSGAAWTATSRAARVQAVGDGVNGKLARFEQIKRFRVLPRDFTAEEDEVTPTLKLKRRVVAEHFAREIEELYSS